jgi:uncharacterized protein YjbI with pentapeptide repeats
MATSNNSAFYLEALKAIKLQGESAPAGSDARKLYSVKADSLRNILKTQFGMMNIDADYGAGIALKDTPGGGNIDWNVLSNAADILGTSQAGSTRSAFDRALGEYLTRNLPVWQKASATASPSAAITATSTPVMGGTGAAQTIVGGGNINPTGPPTGIGPGGTNVTPITPAIVGQPVRTGPVATPTTGTPIESRLSGIAPTGTGAGMGTGTNVYGDFIKSQYFANNDYEGYFISKTPNIPTVKDPTTGKVTIDWANPSMPANMYTLYGNGVGFWNTAQGLSKEQNTFNATDIEKNPAFIEQGKVFTAEMELLLKQNGLTVDAQLAGLKGSIEANKAGLEYELTTIKREVAASNWRSRQSLAASGMAFSGMLGYLYGQNEGKAMDNTIRATSVSAAEIKAMGEQMAILEGSKLSYASDLEGLYGAKRAAYRASILDPQNARYTEVGQLLDTAIAGLEGTTAMSTPSLVLGQKAEAAAAQTANFDTAVALAKLGKQGIWVTPSADGKSYTWTTGLTDAEQTSRDSALFDQWYKTEGVNLDWAKLTDAEKQQTFANWATTQGLNLSQAQLAETIRSHQAGENLNWAQLSETQRHNQTTEMLTSLGIKNTTTTLASGYDPDADYTSLKSGNTPPSVLGLAATRLTAGLGAVSGTTLDTFLNGTTYYWDEVNGKYTLNVPMKADGKTPDTAAKKVTAPGLLGLTADQAAPIVGLIADPVMRFTAAISYDMKGYDPKTYGDKSGNDALLDLAQYVKETPTLTNAERTALAEWAVATYWPNATAPQKQTWLTKILSGGAVGQNLVGTP